MNTKNSTYRFGAGVALDASLILLWLSLGVGIIGRDSDPANLMYLTMQDTMTKLKMHKLLSALTIAIGVAVMLAKMYADSEPGAIPILLVVSGIGWYFITRARILSRHK